MKHLETKNTFAGAGGGAEDPPPPELKPPKLGDYSLASSYSYAETIDLISDGPIMGLTNKNGYILTPDDYLQGVYLNDIAVQETNDSFVAFDKDVVYDLTGAGGNDPDKTCLKNAIGDAYSKIIPLGDKLYNFKSIDKAYNIGQIRNPIRGGGSEFIDTPLGWEDYFLYSSKKSQSKKALISIVHDDTPQQASEADVLHDHACIDIGSQENDLTNYSGFVGQAIYYATNTVYETDYVLDENDDPTAIIEKSSIDKAREEFIEKFNQYAEQSAIAFNFEIKTLELDSLKQQKICPRTVFWTKECTNGFYSEICLQMSDFDKSLDSSLPTGIYRNKIDEAINDIVDLYNTTTSRFTKEYIKERFKAFNGGVLPVDAEGNDLDINKSLMKQTITANISRKIGLSTNFSNWIFPYMFLSYEKDQVLDGYHDGLDDIFINTDVNIDELEIGVEYNPGDTFYYDGKYYEVNYGRGVESIEPNPGAQDEDPPIGSGPDDTEIYFTGVPFETDGVDIADNIASGLAEEVDDQTSSETTVLSELILDEKEIETNLSFDVTSSKSPDRGFSGSTYMDFLIPVLDDDGKWTSGKVIGFTMRMLNAEPVTSRREVKGAIDKYYSSIDKEYISEGLISRNRGRIYGYRRGIQYLNILYDKEEIKYLNSIDGFAIYEFERFKIGSEKPKKYNYSNVLAEFRYGGQNQDPLRYFKDIYIDHIYNSNLLGPFRQGGKGVQRLRGAPYSISPIKKIRGRIPRANFASNKIPEMSSDFLLAREEGSFDRRKTKWDKDGVRNRNFAKWNKGRKKYDEKAQPITHVIENPNVEACFITLNLQRLQDTAVIEYGKDTNARVDFGTEIPNIVNIRVEVGTIDEDGEEDVSYDRFFQIAALVKNPAYIDIGNPDNSESIQGFKDIRELEPDVDINLLEDPEYVGNEGGLYTPFSLPKIERDDITTSDTSKIEDLKIKRYIKVTKLSTETESALMSKTISLQKVTEIIYSQCNYPLSAVVGTKLDSRIFTEIPKRTYRAKLKMVKIPSNYEPIFSNGKDKRYFNSISDFESESRENKHVYIGDWDGTFKFGWTDNPAWILYDMLVTTRYGLGEHITEDQVNKWDLYKIARFCDSVDSNGYFEGVSDGRGGLEPRFSCNIAFLEGTKVFDAINSIAAIFRGIVFFENSKVTFSDDRIKKPMALFTNSNVEGGLFSYSSYKRDEKFNAVEIAYKDRNDDFKTKIEYVENEKDIADRGLFKKEIVAAGVTSKAMAIRAARHVMYQTTKENETVAFTAGSEVLLCKPGDLVIIEDDLKTLRSNFGRVLAVDENNKTIRTSRIFKADDYENSITVYIPTGKQQKEELDYLAGLTRERVTGFTIQPGETTYLNFDDDFVGNYAFSEYADGYIGQEQFETVDGLYEQYAVYTGDNASQPVIWFNTGVTGWVFSVGGEGFKDDNTYDKFITEGLGNEVFYFYDLKDNELDGTSGVAYDTAQPDRRTTTRFSFKDKFAYLNDDVDLDYFNGVIEDNIEINGNPQIRNFDVTGWSALSSSQKEYGDLVYIDQNNINSNLLKFIPVGSTYRFQSRDATDQVYKILTINEKDNHSYEVTASKYNSGKFDEIENGIDFTEDESTYGYTQKVFNVNDITYYRLDTPELTLVTGEDTSLDETNPLRYYISGDWASIDKATGYNVTILQPQGSFVNLGFTDETSFSYASLYLGEYIVKVKAIANNFINEEINVRYDDSVFGSDRIFVETAVDNTQDQSSVITFDGGGIE